jgi:hypothetical protein
LLELNEGGNMKRSLLVVSDSFYNGVMEYSADVDSALTV